MNSNNYDSKGVSSRIKEIIDLQLGGNASQMASDLGTSEGSIRNYVNGKTIPRADMVVNICSKYNKSFDWLLLGEDKKTEYPSKINQHINGIGNNIVSEHIRSLREIENSLEKGLSKTDLTTNIITQLLSLIADKDKDIREKDQRIYELTNRLLECLKG